MDKDEAIKAIEALFQAYNGSFTTQDEQDVRDLSKGKLYELFVLAEVVDALALRGCTLQFRGASLKFKASPGKLKATDPHFEVRTPHGDHLWLFVDIEFDTLGHDRNHATDRSRRHELDIVLVRQNSGYPTHQEVWFAVECKAVANFTKGLVKEVLGVRRELSFLRDAQPSVLSQSGAHPSIDVPAEPASEFWLAHIDPKGSRYRQSPAAFGVDFRHIEP